MSRKSFRTRLVVVFALVLSVVVFAAAKFGSSAQRNDKPTAPLAPTITATDVATVFTDTDGDGRADPGDTLLYTVTISNTAGVGNDATGVSFTDTLDSKLTLVGGSLNVTPVATDDPNYLAIGNVRIQPNAANGVLTNDIDPSGGTLTASSGATSTNGGNVTMNSNGSFIYNPAPGFAGTDTFTYTATSSNGGTANGTVTVKVGNGTSTPGTNVIWFVDPAASAVGADGRLTNPFPCYTGVAASCFSQTAADDPGDTIFLYSGAHTGGNTLLNNQLLIGQGTLPAGASTLATLAGFTIPPAANNSDALPATTG